MANPFPPQTPETLIDAPAFEEPKFPVMLPFEAVINILKEKASLVKGRTDTYHTGYNLAIQSIKASIEAFIVETFDSESLHTYTTDPEAAPAPAPQPFRSALIFEADLNPAFLRIEAARRNMTMDEVLEKLEKLNLRISQRRLLDLLFELDLLADVPDDCTSPYTSPQYLDALESKIKTWSSASCSTP